jgi:hypothetical protein
MGAIDLTNDGHIYFPSNDGKTWVSEKQRRINQILVDYDPKLQLQWIPPGHRNEKDEAFRVVCFPENSHPYLICTAAEADERLLASVFQSDQAKHGAKSLTWLDNYNNAVKIYNTKRNEEMRHEAHEIAAAAFRSNKSSYKVRSLRTGELIDVERPGRR